MIDCNNLIKLANNLREAAEIVEKTHQDLSDIDCRLSTLEIELQKEKEMKKKIFDVMREYQD